MDYVQPKQNSNTHEFNLMGNRPCGSCDNCDFCDYRLGDKEYFREVKEKQRPNAEATRPKLNTKSTKPEKPTKSSLNPYKSNKQKIEQIELSPSIKHYQKMTAFIDSGKLNLHKFFEQLGPLQPTKDYQGRMTFQKQIVYAAHCDNCKMLFLNVIVDYCPCCPILDTYVLEHNGLVVLFTDKTINYLENSEDNECFKFVKVEHSKDGIKVAEKFKKPYN